MDVWCFAMGFVFGVIVTGACAIALNLAITAGSGERSKTSTPDDQPAHLDDC